MSSSPIILSEPPLLPNTVKLLFTTHPPALLDLYDPPPLPVTLQHDIEVPEFRLLEQHELPPVADPALMAMASKYDSSDAYYTKKHQPGEALERKGRKQERDRLVQERIRLRRDVEALRSEVASSAYYANASPVKGGHRLYAPTPVASERVKEAERLKRKQLQDSEDMLRKYDQLLEPREPYGGGGPANGSASSKKGAAARTFTSGGKGMLHSLLMCLKWSSLSRPGHADPPHPPPSLTLLRTGPSAQSPFLHSAAPGIPPAPRGISPHDFLDTPRAQSPMQGVSAGSAAVAYRNIGTTSASGPPSRSGSPGTSMPTFGAIANGNGTAPLSNGRTARANGSKILIAPKRADPLAPASSGAAQSDLLGRRSRATKGIPMQALQFNLPQPSYDQGFGYQQHPLSIVSGAPSSSSPAAQTKKRRRRRAKGHSSEDDDGRQEAIAAMEASKEFLDDEQMRLDLLHDPYGARLSAPQTAPVLSRNRTPLTDDGDTDASYTERPRPQRRKRAPREAAAIADIASLKGKGKAKPEYWEYTGPPTIVDSFFRIQQPGSNGERSPSITGGSQPPLSPERRTTRAAYAWGSKVPERAFNVQRDFSIDRILQEMSAPPAPLADQPPMLGPAVPALAPLPTPQLILPHPYASLSGLSAFAERPMSAHALSPAPQSTTLGRRRLPRASSSRASTPASTSAATLSFTLNPPVQAPVQYRPPRTFRSKPDSPNGAQVSPKEATAKQTIVIAASAAFDSDGELSSVSSETSDNELDAQDSDTKWRTDRATRHLEAEDKILPRELLAVIAKSKARPANKGGNSLFPPGPMEGKRRNRSPSATPEPSGPIYTTIGGIKTRRRVQLSEYPPNELAGVHDIEMAGLRRSYVAVSRKKEETLGKLYMERPYGEWQIHMMESNVRGATW